MGGGLRVRAAFVVATICIAITAGPSLAALEIAMSVSPAQGVAGGPMEVLVRTFTPIRAGDIQLPTPSVAYPAPSGLWNVLYPFPDFGFAVIALSPTGKEVTVDLVLDPGDASLWRGAFIPDEAGQWTIQLRNSATPPLRVTVTSRGDANPWIVGLIGLLAGLLVGLVLGRSRWRFGAAPEG
jgi:hypothetical protein